MRPFILFSILICEALALPSRQTSIKSNLNDPHTAALHHGLSARGWIPSNQWRTHFEKGVTAWNNLQNTLANPPASDVSNHITLTEDEETGYNTKVDDWDPVDQPGWRFLEQTEGGVMGPLSDKLQYALSAINQPTNLQFTVGEARLFKDPNFLVRVYSDCERGILVLDATRTKYPKSDGKWATAPDKYYNVLWALYRHVCPDPTKLKYIIVEDIENGDTQALLKEIAWTAGRFDPRDLGKNAKAITKWTPSDKDAQIQDKHADFYALAHVPNLIGITYMAKDYSNGLGRKDIDSISAFYTYTGSPVPRGLTFDWKVNPETHNVIVFDPHEQTGETWSLIMILRNYIDDPCDID